MVWNYHLMCFTMFVQDLEAQFKMGYSLQYSVIFAIAVNIAKMAWAMYKKGSTKLNKKRNIKAYEDKL